MREWLHYHRAYGSLAQHIENYCSYHAPFPCGPIHTDSKSIAGDVLISYTTCVAAPFESVPY